MKGLLGVLFLTLMMSASAIAQNSTMAPQSDATQSPTMARQNDMPMAQQTRSSASMPDSGSSGPASTHKTYSSEGYGGRAEILVTGFGLFGTSSNGNAIIEQQTNAGGVAAGYRFRLNSSSALEGRYGFSRTSQKYTIGGAVSSIPSYFSEISGSYVYTFSKSQRIQPFLEGGAGVALFIPGNYNTPASSTTAGSPIGGTPTGYALPTFHAEEILGPVYSGSSSGIGTQARVMFLYGAGVDIPASSHFYFMTEFRGLGYQAPDFKLNPLHANAFSFSYEPSVGIAYRF